MEYGDIKQTVLWCYFFKTLITRHVILYFFNSSSFLGHYVCMHAYAYTCTCIHTYICVCMYVCTYLNLFFFCTCSGFFSFPFVLSACVDCTRDSQDADHSASVDSVLMKLLRSLKLSICINTFRNKVWAVSRHLNLNIWILLLFDLLLSMTSVTTRLT